MNPLALLILMTTGGEAPKWYGPESVTFRTIFAGNPYDWEKNDMRVRFLDGRGNQVERLAYFDEEEAGWKAVLLADKPGKYRAVLVRNGKETDAKPIPEFIDLAPAKGKGFIRRDPSSKTRFRYEDATPYVPLGFNVGWQSPNLPEIPDMLRKMGKNGINWSRIWACNWDGKNPWWPNEEGQLEPGSTRMWAGAFHQWDRIVAAAEEAGVGFQFVLFNHGAFSTKVNPNWKDHPWNEANGGFLKKAADFFTDPEAKKRTKMWLRYAVARYGHSPSVMAWELFNEVEWVDARYEDRWKDVLTWHKEMAEFLRSIDPYQHLIATSSTFEFPGLYEAVDYYQPHTYPADIRTAISHQAQPGDKPLFFGEYGPTALEANDQAWAVRDGIWAGLLSGQAGAGSFWSWEVVERDNLYEEYKRTEQILQASGLRERPAARPIKLRVATNKSGDLRFAPGAGWVKATKTSFTIKAGEKPEGLGELPSFLQGPNHRDLFPAPLVFALEAPKAGEFKLHLAQVAKAGARIKVSVNGAVKVDRKFEPSEKDRAVSEPIVVPFKAGHNQIGIENIEGDWVNVRSFTFSGMDAEVSAQAIGQIDWLMVRLTANGSEPVAAATLSGFGLKAGKYEATIFNVEDGTSTTRPVEISGVADSEKFMLPSRDTIVVLKLAP